MQGGGDEYSYVLVEDEGQTSSYSPNTTDKDHHTTVFVRFNFLSCLVCIGVGRGGGGGAGGGGGSPPPPQ